MVYQINCTESDEIYFLEHHQSYTQKEFITIVNTVKFELSHHIDVQNIIRVLCENYDFKEVVKIDI